jgi:chromosome segregation ATPase
MTTEERFERIEHLTAGIAEERRKDREEYKALWRDTQRQLNEVSARLVQLSEADEEARAADRRLEARIEQLANESRAANKQLEERIEMLVSRFGEVLAKLPRQ